MRQKILIEYLDRLTICMDTMDEFEAIDTSARTFRQYLNDEYREVVRELEHLGRGEDEQKT